MDCVIEIVIISIHLLCSKVPLLLLITLVLIFPVSSITLSQVMSGSFLASHLSTSFHDHLHAWVGDLQFSPFSWFFFSQLSQAVVVHAMRFPIIITLWVLAKATIFYILRCMERGDEASMVGFLEEGPRIWIRVAMTYASGCVLVICMTGMVVLLEVMGLFLVGEMVILNRQNLFTGLVTIFLEIGMVSMYAIILAPMVVVLHMSTVVAAMEDNKSGSHAIIRALSLLKQRKIQPALLLFVITGTASVVIECAFQYRVLGRDGAFATTRLLEAPFLIFAHSCLWLFDTLMSFSFYYACRAGGADMLASHGRGCIDMKEKVDVDVGDHFSIAMQIVDQQCNKIIQHLPFS